MNRRNLQLLSMGWIAVLLLVVTLALSGGSLLPGWALDFLWRLNGPFKLPEDAGGFNAKDQVAIVAIDNQTLRFLRGTSERLPRSVYGNIVASLTELGAKTIGFDVTFDQPGIPEEDAVLVQAVKAAGRVVTNAYLVNDEDITRLGVRGQAFFREFSANEGLADIDLDRDHYLRRTRLYYRRGDLPCRISFALATFLAHQGTRKDDIRFTRDTIHIPVPPPGSPPVPFDLDSEGRALIGFLGEPRSIRTISAYDLLQGRVEPAEISGKVILVGGTAEEFRDNFHTPFSHTGTMPGVEVHAHILVGLLAQRIPHEINNWTWRTLLILIAFLTAIISGLFKSEKALFGVVPIAMLWLPTNISLFAVSNMFTNMFDIWVALGCGWVSATLLDAWFLRQEKLQIANLFGQYVSPNLLKELLEHPEALALGGARREAVVLFADVRGFTRLCEERPPEEVISMLNTYFSSVTSHIFENHGVLDKYIGDGLMAFFGVPLSHGNEAENAINAALDMKESLFRLRAGLPSGADFPIEAIGIGINGGEVVVGNVGSQSHMEYTLLGDTVNVAARLESMCSLGEIFISDWVREKLPEGMFDITPKGPTPIRGRAEPVEVFEVRGRKEPKRRPDKSK